MSAGIIDLPEAIAGEILPAIPVTLELFVPNGLDRILNHIKNEVEKHVPDISTERGRKEIASLAYKVSKSNSYIEKTGKEYAAGIKIQAVAIDAERKRSRDFLDKLRDDTRKPLTDWENAEIDRLKRHEDGLTALAELANVPFGETLDTIGKRIEAADEFAMRDWQEFAKRFASGYEYTLLRLTKLYTETKKHEEDQAELLRLQEQEAKRLQEERDTRMKEEAAAQAKQQAELEAKHIADETAQRVAQEKAAIEQTRIDAEERTRKAEAAAQEVAEKALRDAEAAAAKAKADQEAAIEHERRRVAEAKRTEDEAIAKREANAKHCARINKEITDKLVSCGFTSEVSTALIVAISKGGIPHMKISY